MAYIDKLISTNEQILLKQRMHWAALLATFWSAVSSLIGIAILYVVYSAVVLGAGPLARYIPAVAGTGTLRLILSVLPSWAPLAVLALLIVNVLWQLLWRVLNWLNSMNIVTSRRVIQVHGVLSKSSIDSSLEKVNDVLLQQSFVGRIIGYGHLKIMTASETGLNVMRFLPDPLGFKRVLLDSKQQLNDSGGTLASAHVSAPSAPAPAVPSVADRLHELQKLKDQGLISEAEFTAKRENLLADI